MANNHQLKLIMKKLIIVLISLNLFAIGQARVLYVASAGTLSVLLTATEKDTITRLTLTGNIDARDVKCMRDEIVNLAILNLTDASILAYNGSGGTSEYNPSYSANKIPDFAFYNAGGTLKLKTIDLPSSVSSIGNSAFSFCKSLVGVTFGSGVLTIDNYAFRECTALTNFIIPNSVTTIGEQAFGFCTALTGLSIGNSVTTIGINAFYGCSALTSVIIPDAVTSIADGAFYLCSGITNLTLGNSVSSLGYSAFCGCSNLLSVTIPKSVTSIGPNAFKDCTSLTGFVVHPDNLNYSSTDGVFFSKDQHTLIQYPGAKPGAYLIPSQVTLISEGAFLKCSGLSAVTIPGSVTTIGSTAFSYCSGLTGIIIPDAVTTIGASAFANCTGLTSLIISNSLTAIEGAVFSYCSGLTSVSIPDAVISIAAGAFYNCYGLTSLTFGNSVTTIGVSAFSGCSGLTSLTIPATITSIGDRAFFSCSGLGSIYANPTIPVDISAFANVFTNVNKTNCTLYVPVGSISAYQEATRWKDFVNIVELTTALQKQNVDTIELCPNSVTDGFYIKGLTAAVSITVVDINGKQLFSKRVTPNEFVSAGLLPSGMSIVKIATMDGQIQRKIWKK